MGFGGHAASGVRWNSAAAISAVVLQLARTLVLSRLLDPTDFGIIAMTMTFISLASIYADAGVNLALLYRLDATRAQLSSLFWLNFACSCLVFGILFMAAPAGAWFYGTPDLTAAIRVMACTFLIAPLGQQSYMLLMRDLRFRTVATIRISSEVLSTASVIVLAVMGFGYWAMAVSFLVGAAVSSSLLLAVGWAQYRPSVHFRWGEIRSFVSFGVLQLLERTLDSLEDQSDQIIVGRLLGAEVLGVYVFAKTFANLPLLKVNPIIMSVALPIFARIKGENDRLRSAYIRVLRVILSIDSILLVGAAATAPVAIPLLFGERWIAAVPLLQVLAIVGLARGIRNPAGSLAFVFGDAGANLKWNAAFICASAPAIYLCARWLGPMGAAAASAGVFALSMLPLYRVLVRPYTGPCGSDYLKAIAGPVLIAVSACLPSALLGSIFAASWITLLTQVLIGALLALALSIRFAPSMIDEVRAFVGRAKSAPDESSVAP
jgi:O-antigen/teichoic acid export membrane protein